MKLKIFVLLLFGLTLISCTGCPSNLETVETWSDGNPKKEIYWLDKKDSIFREITYFKNGQINQKHIITNGELEKMTAYYETGEIAALIMYENGKPVAGAEYYKNGQKRGEISYDLNGNLNGIARYFNEDGSLSTEGEYKNDKRHGVWRNYDEQGVIIKEEVYY
ncbi:toxin-antitoxin system YwqK family antitoxin [Salinimicrobium gaetbulicola]|uniref:Toxin-antitoxin system YwqK family antitoxin n=1 Tax=Salinimicrobium gaetbulicola TaxID=999702 RepID=A0ABW3ICN8_9FLAO